MSQGPPGKRRCLASDQEHATSARGTHGQGFDCAPLDLDMEVASLCTPAKGARGRAQLGVRPADGIDRDDPHFEVVRHLLEKEKRDQFKTNPRHAANRSQPTRIPPALRHPHSTPATKHARAAMPMQPCAYSYVRVRACVCARDAPRATVELAVFVPPERDRSTAQIPH